MDFLYVGEDLQIMYSPQRAALGEYVRGQHRWLFLGWLYDGEVRDRTDAIALTKTYLRLIGRDA